MQFLNSLSLPVILVVTRKLLLVSHCGVITGGEAYNLLKIAILSTSRLHRLFHESIRKSKFKTVLKVCYYLFSRMNA